MIRKMLRNEKNVGDVVLLKTNVEGLFCGRREESIDQRSCYLIKDYYLAVVSRKRPTAANLYHGEDGQP